MSESLTDTGALSVVNAVRETVAEVEGKVAQAPGARSEVALVMLGSTLRELGCALRSLMLTGSALKKVYRSAFAAGREQGRAEGYAEGYAAAVAAQAEPGRVPLQAVRDAS